MAAISGRELGTGKYLLPSAHARAAARCRADADCKGLLASVCVWRRHDVVVAFAVPVGAGTSRADIGAAGALSLGKRITLGLVWRGASRRCTHSALLTGTFPPRTS